MILSGQQIRGEDADRMGSWGYLRSKGYSSMLKVYFQEVIAMN